ncbi:MAG: aldo/keto reductase [Phycisphaeraceae bacterium]|nr:aldo/keto reductase [Phycisphaeraceae bacterium]
MFDPFKPRRSLGKTGFLATPLGIGDLADRSVPLAQCVATARRAIDRGLNLIDTAPMYEAGYSEEIVGQAVQGVREKMFIIDKVDHLDQPVGPQVDESLQRLRLDHVDLFAFHAVSTLEAWRKLAAPGGGMDQLEQAVQAGKARFRGISSHHPDVLREAITSGTCDVVMFPLGPFVDERYFLETLPLARGHEVGTVCFKTFGAGKLLGDTSGYNQPLTQRPRGKFSSGGKELDGAAGPQLPHLAVLECVHYTLTLDPDVTLLGLSFPNEQDAAFAAAEAFKPLAPAAMADLRRRAVAAIAEKGPCWWNPPASL